MKQTDAKQRRAERSLFDELDAMANHELEEMVEAMDAILPNCHGGAIHFFGRIKEHAIKRLADNGHIWGL